MTGVQTCALPIYGQPIRKSAFGGKRGDLVHRGPALVQPDQHELVPFAGEVIRRGLDLGQLSHAWPAGDPPKVD